MTNRQRQDAQARMARAARQPHAHNPMACNPFQCQTCYGAPGDALHILPLPGMESADTDRVDAAATAQGDELTAKMREPLRDVSAMTGRMERDAPLFFGTGSNPTLF